MTVEDCKLDIRGIPVRKTICSETETFRINLSDDMTETNITQNHNKGSMKALR
jgi:hypothetical protein